MNRKVITLISFLDHMIDLQNEIRQNTCAFVISDKMSENHAGQELPSLTFHRFLEDSDFIVCWQTIPLMHHDRYHNSHTHLDHQCHFGIFVMAQIVENHLNQIISRIITFLHQPESQSHTSSLIRWMRWISFLESANHKIWTNV